MKRVLLFAIIAVIALAMVGVSSAAWSVPDMQVQGTVQTGTIDGHFSNPWVFQIVPPTDGTVTALVSADGYTLTISLPKSKKDYSAIVTFSVRNVGTIPLKINDIIVNAPAKVTATPFGEGAIIAVGSSASGFGLWVGVSKKARLPATITVTLDSRSWIY